MHGRPEPSPRGCHVPWCDNGAVSTTPAPTPAPTQGTTPRTIHADRTARTLRIEWADGHETRLRPDRPALAVPVCLLPGRGGHARLARLRPDPDRPSRPDSRTCTWSATTPWRRTGATATTPATTRSTCCAITARAPACTADGRGTTHPVHDLRRVGSAPCRMLSSPASRNDSQELADLMAAIDPGVPCADLGGRGIASPAEPAAGSRTGPSRSSTASCRWLEFNARVLDEARDDREPAARAASGSWPSSPATSTSSSRSASPA